MGRNERDKRDPKLEIREIGPFVSLSLDSAKQSL